MDNKSIERLMNKGVADNTTLTTQGAISAIQDEISDFKLMFNKLATALIPTANEHGEQIKKLINEKSALTKRVERLELLLADKK